MKKYVCRYKKRNAFNIIDKGRAKLMLSFAVPFSLKLRGKHSLELTCKLSLRLTK